MDFGKLYHSLTTLVDVRWNEGEWDSGSMPFSNTSITIRYLTTWCEAMLSNIGIAMHD